LAKEVKQAEVTSMLRELATEVVQW